MNSRHLFVGALAVTLSLAVSLPASAQSQSQLRDAWLPWLGCWNAEGAPADEKLCIVPEGNGVRMITIQRGGIVAESRVIADGSERSVRYNDCSGTEVAIWSEDRRRVFLRSNLTCTNGGARNASGIFAFMGTNQWLSVQAVTTGNQTATATVRYTSVAANDVPSSVATALLGNRSASAAARASASAAADAEDVDEALNQVNATAVDEWLRSTDQSYQLADAGDVDVAETGYASALDLAGRTEVVYVLPAPVHVHRTYVFGGHYFGRYSPWGYDWFGWRIIGAPIVYVRGGRISVSHSSFGRHHFTGVVRRDRDWSRSWNGGRATRNGYTRDRDSGHRGDRDSWRSGDRDSGRSGDRDSWRSGDRESERNGPAVRENRSARERSSSREGRSPRQAGGSLRHR